MIDTHDIQYYNEETNKILVEVQPYYVPERSNPDYHQYFYAYRIRITNHSDKNVKLVHRHWKIKDGQGKTYEVKGQGVVGEQPLLKSNDSFEYSSFCPLHSPFGNMRGKFLMTTEEGESLVVNVPLFFFRPPETFLQ